MQAECSAFLPGLIINGKVTEYYENGKTKAEGTYKDNTLLACFSTFTARNSGKNEGICNRRNTLPGVLL